MQTCKYDDTCTFNSFLDDLGLTHEEYMHAISFTLNRTTMLLQRIPLDMWTNSFSRHIPKIWNANTDSQFILDSYATTTYCTLYMMKFDKTMTSTFRCIREEHKKKNVDIIKTISKLGKDLVTMQQMFAQLVVHIVLPLPLNFSSRNCIFTNTSPIDDRAFMLKKKNICSMNQMIPMT